MKNIPESAWHQAHAAWPWPDGTVVDEAICNRPVLALVAEAVKRHGALVALEDREHRLSFEAMWSAIGRVSREMEGSSGPVGILLPMGPAYSVAFLACLAAGRIALLMDPGWPLERTSEILSRAGAGLLVLPAGVASVGGIPSVVVRLDGDASGEGPSLQQVGSMPVDAPAIILCTSGSTGVPKTIVHSQRSMMGKVWAHLNGMGARAGDLCLSLIPPATLAGVIGLIGLPVVGAGIRFVDLRVEGIGGLLAILGARPVTLLRSAPSALRLITALPNAAEALRGVRNVVLTGEPVMQADIAALRPVLAPGAAIYTTYGSTESGSIGWFPLDGDMRDEVRVPAGLLMPGTSAVIVDEDGVPCEADEAGELVLRSPYNALGEWHAGRVRTGMLLVDPVDPSRRVHHTGDIVRRGSDDVYVVLGRKDRMLKINGQRVEPGEIEAALRGCEGVADCAVVSPNGRTIVGFVVLEGAGGVERIRAAVRGRLPAAMLPSRIVPLDALPRLPGGKVDLVRLTAMAKEPATA